jgi:TM2 domain-containing membrane protein YozV
MKKALLVLALACSVSVFSYAAETTATSSEYFVNDSQVENMFATSANVSEASPALLAELDPSNTYTAAARKQQNVVYDGGDKSAVLAIVLDFFLGGLGIHRLYLGTKTFTWVGYILTCGGIFGIVPLVDFVVLIINSSDISEYVDNTKFFMW